jgi:hypothetical protein
VLAVALAVPCGALKDKERLFWFLVAAAAIVACKPHGRPLWLGLVIVAVAMAGNPLKWEWKSLAAIAVAVLIIFTSGSDRQGSWLLLNSAFPFVKTQGEPYSEYRAILRPFVEKARADLENFAEKQSIYKKPLSGSRNHPMLGDQWIELSKNKDLYQRVARRLAFEAILSHPLEYAQLVVRKIARTGHGTSPARISPAEFWKAQESANAERIKRPKNQIKLLYGMETDAYLRLVEERRQRTTWMAPWMEKLGRALRWTKYRESGPSQSPEIGLTALGWLLALGLVACLSPRHFVCRALLWVPVVLYLFITFSVGDSVRRYLHPVEWVAIVLIVIGLDAMVTLITSGIARVSPPPRTEAPQSGVRRRDVLGLERRGSGPHAHASDSVLAVARYTLWFTLTWVRLLPLSMLTACRRAAQLPFA